MTVFLISVDQNFRQKVSKREGVTVEDPSPLFQSLLFPILIPEWIIH